jgi:uncharacterized protein (UPF0147 family)
MEGKNMSSNNLTELTDLISKLNKHLSTPVCSRELTSLSKQIQRYSQLENEITSAGRLAKRGLKKQQEQIQVEIKKGEEGCLECIYDSIIKTLKPKLDDQANSLSTVAPQASKSLKGLNLPLTSEINAIHDFIKNLETILENSIKQVRDLCSKVLDENKSKITNYSDLVKIESNALKQSKSLNDEILSTYDPQGLITIYFELIEEGKLIDLHLSSSKNLVQEKMLQQTHDLLYSINEAEKGKIITDSTEYQGIQRLISEIEQAKTIYELNQLHRSLSTLTTKFSTTIKSEITRIKSSINNIIVQIRGLFPTLSDKYIPLPSEISMTNASISELTNYLEQIQTWKTNVINGVKRIASTEELYQVNEGVFQEGVSIPNTLLANAKEQANHVQEVQDNLEEVLIRLKNYHVYHSQFLEILREEIRKNLNFEATDSDSKALISLKPPLVVFETDSPTELLNYLRSVNLWKNKLVNVLQEARHAINDTITIASKIEKKGINNFPPNFQTELNSLYDKMASESDIQTLLLYRRSYDRLYKQFVTRTAAFIKDYVKNVTILELIQSDPNVPTTPFVEDASELDLSELLDRIDEIEDWKQKTLSFLKNKIEALSFPMIPGEVPVDLRKEKNDLIMKLTGTSASRNSIAMFKAYFEFMKLMSSSKSLMIEECSKQIELVDSLSRSSLAHFKEEVGSLLMFEIPSDLEALDYSDLLELWFRLHTYNTKRSELVQLKARDILSGWLKQYKSLPAHYLGMFNQLFLVLEQGITELSQSKNLEDIMTKFEYFLNNATTKAQEGLEKLKAFFYNKVTVSLPRIVETMGEVSPEVRKVHSYLESTVPTEGQTLESLNRLIVETIHDYDYILIAKLMELLSVASKNLLQKISNLQTCGLANIQHLVGEQIEVFTQLIQADTSDMMSIEMLTQSFVELDKILKNEELQKSLFEIIDSTNTTATRILDFIQALGWKNTQQMLMPHVVRIKQARNAVQFWSFDLIANSTIETVNATKLLLESIRELEKKNYELYLDDLSNDPNIPYYHSIHAVFEYKLDESSETIFPLKEIFDARAKLQVEDNLNEVYNILAAISKLKTQWKQESLPLITKWHRLLFLFISDYIPSTVHEVKVGYIANAKREIEEAYSHQPMIKYLSFAVEYYVMHK